MALYTPVAGKVTTLPGAIATVGNYFIAQQGVVTAAALTGSYQILYLFPMYVSDTAVPIDRACLEVTVLGTGVVRHGVYANDPTTGQPLASGPAADFGTIDITTTGIKESTVTATLPAGWHWYGYVWQTTNTTGPTMRVLSAPSGLGPLGIGSTSALAAGSRQGFYLASVTGALGALSTLSIHALLPPRVTYRRA